MFTNLLTLAIGAGLACLGMLAGAFADRIRYGRAQRARAARAPREAPAVSATSGQALDQDDQAAVDKDARSAIVGLGYKKWIATEAVRVARAKLGPNVELVDLTQAALRACTKVMSAEGAAS